MTPWPLMLVLLVTLVFVAGMFAFLVAILLRHGHESCRARRGEAAHV